MSFTFYLTVRGYELDSYDHVNNAVYLNFYEQARWEIFRESGYFEYFKENGLLLVVTEIKVKYIREAKLFDELVVNTEIKSESPYLIFTQKIYNTKSNLKISSATVKTLMINSERIPCDLPDEMLAKLKNN